MPDATPDWVTKGTLADPRSMADAIPGCPLTPFQQFGLFTGITILYALIAAIVVVPPMLVVWADHYWRQTAFNDHATQHQ